MFNIKITQFINPHLFYYQYEEDEDLPRSYDEDLKRILPKKQYFLETEGTYRPQLNEIVGHYNIVEDKWIRCQVDHITYKLCNKEKIFYLFALDYGHSLESIGKWLYPLPESMKQKSKTIFLGGINNLVPCQYAFDHSVWLNEHKLSDNWSSRSILMVTDMITTCRALKFCPEIRLTGGHLFGKLMMTTLALDEVDVSDMLLDQHYAMRSNQFMRELTILNTIKVPRWQSNDGNAGSFGLSTVKPYVTGHVQPVDNEMEIPETLDLFMQNIRTKVITWQMRQERFFATAGDSEVHHRASEIIEQLQELSMTEEPRRKPMERNSINFDDFPLIRGRGLNNLNKKKEKKILNVT
ncbi:hypothetical protein DMENIID0001_136940 [Sergentomyia squamirostris]